MSTRGLNRVEKISLSLAGVTVVLILVPFYGMLRDLKYTRDCTSNLKDIRDALIIYQQDHDGLLPPAYYRQPDGTPLLDSQGRPETWVKAIYRYVKQRPRNVFKCPAAPLDSCTLVSNPESPTKTFALSYGFYTPVGSQDPVEMTNPAQTALIMDSVAGGKLGTLNPYPLLNGNDGFLILPTPDGRFMTRLAIGRMDEDKDWTEASNLRSLFHGRGINMLMAGGQVITQPPSILYIQRDSKGKQKPPWVLPEAPDGVYYFGTPEDQR